MKQEQNINADIEAINSISVVPTILNVICRTTGMGFAAVARVTDKQWIACSVRDEINFGLKPGEELKLETTICHEIRQSGSGVIIDHVALDEQFANHHTPAMYGFQSYISLPIFRKDGTFFGTLCAIDPKPAKLNNEEIINMFKLYTDLIAFHLEAVERVSRSEQSLSEERQMAELRELFIAVLGHDLRNPIGAIDNAVQILKRMSLDDAAVRFADIIHNSTYRMKGLINNIMDFASGRLGQGVQLNRREDDQLEATIKHVIDELQLVWQSRKIDADLQVSNPVYVDSSRIAQMLSNLLGNALSYSPAESEVNVKATTTGGEFRISIANTGKKITPENIERLFQPFVRGDVKPGHKGLGLGLYIASEIARAHGGRIDVVSDDNETCFTAVIPQKA
ncbi:GAF domain-containing protein [Pedobacter sp. HMF7647]|uniref:histidine kinase n=1 Tax=Hufsiella arboris TaxID=2695275 RepID=A0A7K1YE53_9SPHI|nr:GAF domain-containing sensor histidine kinase [Hufsiella arboris]MXV52641.1 GAF domain-containing protein [Hufsiella arboris]